MMKAWSVISKLLEERLTGDDEVYANPEQYFDQVIEINLSELKPHINGPFTPDLDTKVGEVKAKADANGCGMGAHWVMYQFIL